MSRSRYRHVIRRGVLKQALRDAGLKPESATDLEALAAEAGISAKAIQNYLRVDNKGAYLSAVEPLQKALNDRLRALKGVRHVDIHIAETQYRDVEDGGVQVESGVQDDIDNAVEEAPADDVRGAEPAEAQMPDSAGTAETLPREVPRRSGSPTPTPKSLMQEWRETHEARTHLLRCFEGFSISLRDIPKPLEVDLVRRTTTLASQVDVETSPEWLRPWLDMGIAHSSGQRVEPEALLEGVGVACLLGDPGAGKSKLLQCLAWRSYSQAQSRLVVGPIRCAEVEESSLSIAADDVVVLIDSWDEASADVQRRTWRFIEDWRLGNQEARRVVIASRRVAGPPPSDEVFELLPLKLAAIEDHIDLLARITGRTAVRDRVLGALAGSEQLHGLCSNPLLLHLLWKVADEYGELPSDRGAVYRRAVQMLLARRPASAIGRFLHGAELELVLETLAWELMTRAEDCLSGPDMLETIAAELNSNRILAGEVIAFLHEDAGVLQVGADGNYRFLHLSLQEHLAARYLARTTNALDVLWSRIRPHLFDARWQEFFRQLVAELHDEAEGLLSLVLDEEDTWADDLLALALDMSVDLKGIGSPLLDRLLSRGTSALVKWNAFGGIPHWRGTWPFAALALSSHAEQDVVAEVLRPMEPYFSHDAEGLSDLLIAFARTRRAMPDALPAILGSTPVLEAMREHQERFAAGLGPRSDRRRDVLNVMFREEFPHDSVVVALEIGVIKGLAIGSQEAAVSHISTRMQASWPGGVRRAAIMALGDLGSDKGVPALAKVLSADEKNLNAILFFNACESLRKIGSEAARRHLLKVLRRRDLSGHFVGIAARHLYDFKAAPKPTQEERDLIKEAVRYFGPIADLLDLLASLDYERAQQVSNESVRDKTLREEVRRPAVFYAQEAALEVLAEGTEPTLMAAAVSRWGPMLTSAELRLLTNNKQKWVRDAAVSTLAQRGELSTDEIETHILEGNCRSNLLVELAKLDQLRAARVLINLVRADVDEGSESRLLVARRLTQRNAVQLLVDAYSSLEEVPRVRHRLLTIAALTPTDLGVAAMALRLQSSDHRTVELALGDLRYLNIRPDSSTELKPETLKSFVLTLRELSNDSLFLGTTELRMTGAVLFQALERLRRESALLSGKQDYFP